MSEDDQPPEADRVEGFAHPREALSVFGQDDALKAVVQAWDAGRMHHAWLIPS